MVSGVKLNRKRPRADLAFNRVAYQTKQGVMIQARAEEALQSRPLQDYYGKVHLIFTSPPFPLNRKKRYGNLESAEYRHWLAGFAPTFRRLLRRDGSIVVEMGNAWEPGLPVMSTLALETLLDFLKSGPFHLCQQFVSYNKARLPSPIQWVNVERIRVKDAHTHVWWMSPSARPKANNRRVLLEYSDSMLKLLASKKYNAGKRPSEYDIGEKSFLRDNRGAIPSSVLPIANTRASDPYLRYCRLHHLSIHPSRMPRELAEFFIKFLTIPGDLVLDPFAGSNVTGAVAEGLDRKWVSIEPEKEYVIGSLGRFPGAKKVAH